MFRRQRQLAQQPGHRPCTAETDDRTETSLAQQQQQRVDPTRVGLDPGDERQRQEDSHRIVQARLHLQRRRYPLVEPNPGLAQHREHGGSVGRADDRAEQQAVAPVDTKHPHRDRTDHRSSQHHTDGGQQQSRSNAAVKNSHAGAESAFEQDHRQRCVADPRGNLDVVETHPPRPVDTDQHARHQKNQQERQAQPRREHAGQQAGEDQQTSSQEQQIQGMHRLLKLAERAPASCQCARRLRVGLNANASTYRRMNI